MEHKCVLISGARAPVAVHLARLLNATPHRVVMCDHLNWSLGSASNAKENYRYIPSFRFDPSAAADQLRCLISDERVDFVVPTCEEVFYLAQLWENSDLPARLIAPPLPLLETVHNKFRFIEAVKNMGLSAPSTSLLLSETDRDQFQNIAQSYVFKPVWSRFASNVAIRPNPKAFARIKPAPHMPWVAQRFIHGDEVSVYAFAFEGKLKGLSAYRSLIRAGMGAGVSFEPVNSDNIRSFVETFVGETKWTGQISFDVIIEGNGTVMPLECNPRATSGLHFFKDPKPFANALLGDGCEVLPSVMLPQGVRFAVWIYGLSGLFRRHSFQSFWRALINTQDVLNVRSDPIAFTAQVKSVLEFAQIARRTGRSLQQASTYDLEWDGTDQSSISN